MSTPAVATDDEMSRLVKRCEHEQNFIRFILNDRSANSLDLASAEQSSHQIRSEIDRIVQDPIEKAHMSIPFALYAAQIHETRGLYYGMFMEANKARKALHVLEQAGINIRTGSYYNIWRRCALQNSCRASRLIMQDYHVASINQGGNGIYAQAETNFEDMGSEAEWSEAEGDGAEGDGASGDEDMKSSTECSGTEGDEASDEENTNNSLEQSPGPSSMPGLAVVDEETSDESDHQ